MTAAADPFAKWRVQETNNTEQIQQPEIQQEDPFAKWKTKKESPEEQYKKESELIWEDSGDMERGEERGRAQGTSRLLESTLGTPGNIQSLIKGITGFQVGTQLPTSEDLQSFSEKATLGYTKPETEFEKKAGEVVSDIGAMALPGGTGYSTLRNIGIPLAGFLAKEGLESAGVGEGGSNAAKTAIMVGLDLISAYKNKGRGGAKNYASELWKEGEANIPKGVSVKSENLAAELNALKTELMKGGSSPEIGPAVTKINELLKASKKGTIPVDELIAFRKKINKLVEARGGFKYGTDYKIQQDAVNNLNKVKDKVIGQLDQYGKINPEFGVPYKAANEVYNVYHTSNSIKNFLKSKFGSYLKHPALHMLFSGTVGLGSGSAMATGLALPYQGLKLLYRVYKSPSLAKLYGGVLKGAIANNVSETAKNLSALKNELQEEESSPSKK